MAAYNGAHMINEVFFCKASYKMDKNKAWISQFSVKKKLEKIIENFQKKNIEWL